MYAILSVAYRSTDGPTYIECANPTTVQAKIAELQALPQTVKIGVFLCSQTIELVHRWDAKPYSLPTGDLVEQEQR